MTRKTVAIIGTRGYPSYYGGFETAVRKLAPYLTDEGWDVTVYGRPGTTKPEDPSRDPRIQTITTRGIESKSFSTLSYGFSSTIHAARRKPDVALVMNVANGFWLPLLKLRGVPTLVNVDGIEWDREKWGRLAKGTFRSGARLTATFANDLVFDSVNIEDRWQKDFRAGGNFIPYGGDVPPPLPIEPGLVHRGYVLMVARFVPENTVPEFLEAARAISLKYDVVIVGSSGYGGTLDEAAQQLADKNSRVRWLGHLSDDKRLLSLWQHSGVYFHGHSVGGTNPALVQAMAAGAPVVARDTIYNREVLGEAGGLVEPTPKAIAEGVLALMSDPARQDRISSSVLDRATNDYSWASICAAYNQALRNLITRKK